MSNIVPSNSASIANVDSGLYEGFFKPQDQVPAPPPASGGFMLPLPIIRVNQKEGTKLTLVRQLCADDADDSSAFLVPAPKFRAETVLFAPVMATYRHVAWNSSKKVTDTPGNLSNCDYCLVNQNSSNDQDRCENHCEISGAIIDTCGNMQDPSKWVIKGFYHLDGSRTAFDELYNFYYHEMLAAFKAGQAPYAHLYMLGLKTIVGKHTWNVPRFFRTQDDKASGYWHREFGKDAPDYRKVPTPPSLVEEITRRIRKGTPENFAISMFKHPGIEAGKLMREFVQRGGVAPDTQPTHAVPVQVTVVPTTSESADDAVDAFLGGVN